MDELTKRMVRRAQKQTPDLPIRMIITYIRWRQGMKELTPYTRKTEGKWKNVSKEG